MINHCCICDDNKEHIKTMQVELAAVKQLVRDAAGLLRHRSDGAAHQFLVRTKVKAIIKEGE
jgi:hypothetical protein